MEYPKMSLIIPCYNAEEFLRETLDSILSQDYEDLELIVVDGGSTDKTLEILADYSDSIAFLSSEEDKGQSDAILKGLKQVGGVLWGWLNADDILAPGALHAIAKVWGSEREKPAFIYGRANKVDRHGNILKRGVLTPFSIKKLRSHFFITQPACLFNTAVTEQIGGPRLDLKYAMDWDFTLRLCANGRNDRVLSVDHLIANLRIHENTLTSLGGFVRSREIGNVGRIHGGVFNRNFLAFHILNFFHQCHLNTKLSVFLKFRKISSLMLDRIWGHTNYMIHDHTFS